MPAVTDAEIAALERAIDRMGWEEIHAFRAELRRGQDVYEDAGGFMLRAIRRLFGLPQVDRTVETHQQAARRLVETYASARNDGATQKDSALQQKDKPSV